MTIISSNDLNTSLRIDPYFLSYHGESENKYRFKINFSMLQSAIVKNSYSSLVVTVYGENVVVVPPIPSDNQQNIYEIISKKSLQKKSVLQKIQSVIVQPHIIGLATKLNTSAIPSLKAGINPQQIEALYSQVPSLVVSPFSKPAVAAASNFVSPQEISFRLLTEYKIDPSNIATISEDTNSLISSLKKYYLSNVVSKLDTDPQYFTQMPMRKLKDRIYISSFIEIPKASIGSGNLNFEFRLFKTGENSPVAILKKSIDALYLVNLENQIFSFPNAKASNNVISITHNSKNSNSVEVYKKEMSQFGDFSSYNLNSTITLEKDKKAILKVFKKEDKFQFFRFRSSFQPSTLKSPFFSSVPIGKFKKINSTAFVVTSSPEDKNFVELRTTNLPSDVTQIKIERRQKITNKAFGSRVIVVPYSSVRQNSLITYDTKAISGNVYQYTVFAKTLGGTIRKIASRLYRHVSSAILSTVSTSISGEVSTFKGQPAVTLNISTSVKKDEFIKLKQIFLSQGISEEFFQNFEIANKYFNSVFFHKVDRINLRTGERETFDDLLNSDESLSVTFEDNVETQKKFSISRLDPRASYRYEVRAFIRNPRTMIPGYFTQETATQGSSIKDYYVDHFKWKQPDTLQNGTIFTSGDSPQKGLNRLFEQGEIGTTAVFTTSSFSNFLGIENVFAERISVDKIKLSWQAKTDPSKYDHFIIVKQVDKKREIIATAMEQQMIYHLKKSDRGTVIFYVIPVLNDFSTAEAARIQKSLIIDPEEMAGYGLE